MTNEAAPQEKVLGQYAGFVTRLIAWLIDRLILVAVISIIVAVSSFIVQTLRINELLGLAEGFNWIMTVLVGALAISIPLVYNIGSWMLAGQTLGKWIMGLRIVRTNGERVKFGTCVRRQVGYWISAILFLGFLWALVDNRRQAFHDKLAGTFVVYSWPEENVSVTPVRDRMRRARLKRKEQQTSQSSETVQPQDV